MNDLAQDIGVLIAEDEPLLAAELAHLIEQAWPGARVVETVADGRSAVTRTLAIRPEVCFLDIRMPGQSGLEAARAIAEDWPEHAGAMPLFVFVTAYDQHAVDAFEAAAVDYLLKPVQPQRLQRTVGALSARLSERNALARARSGRQEPASPPALAPEEPDQLSRLLGRLGLAVGRQPVDTEVQARPTRAATEPDGRLRVIQAGSGQTIHLVPVEEVLVFEAADKYVRVLTAEREHLIRVSLRDLLPRLDPDRFWQVHRGTVVRADGIDHALRDETGRITLVMRGIRERPVVSRLYAGRFRVM